MTVQARPALHGWRGPLYAARVIHPFPTLANVLATGLFAVLARRGVPRGDELLRLLLTMFFIQSAIGAANDAVDVDLDRPSKPFKPIVAGALSRRGAVVVAGVAAAAACTLAATFGPAPWLLAMAGLCCGLAYDAGIKRTRFSVIPYVVALPLVPLWVWAALHRYSPSLLWVYPFGILIGMALYFANTAPDITADIAAGVAGTAHRLGVRRTLLTAWGCLALALALGPLVASLAGYRTPVVAGASLAAGVCLILAVLVSARIHSRAALQRGWGLMVVASLLFALGWLAAVP